MIKTYKVELSNKIGRINGRTCAVGNLWGVAEYRNGCRGGYALAPQESESQARETCARLSAGPDVFHLERTTIELTDADIDAEWLTGGFPEEEPPRSTGP